MSLHNIWDHPCLHQRSSCSLIVIIRHSHIWKFVETLLKFHGMSFNMPITHVIHRHHTVSSEWGQCWNFFKFVLYALKFEMVRIGTCLDGMWGLQDSRLCDVLAYKIWDLTRLHQCSSCTLIFIILHSHIWNLSQKSLETSWNAFQRAHHKFHPPTSHDEQWMGLMLKFLQIVPVWVETWHG